MSNTFTCAECGETFEKEWTDEEMREESAKMFPAEKMMGMDFVTVCWPCAEIACDDLI